MFVPMFVFPLIFKLPRDDIYQGSKNNNNNNDNDNDDDVTEKIVVKTGK